MDNRQSDGGCPLTHSPYDDDDGEGGVLIIGGLTFADQVDSFPMIAPLPLRPQVGLFSMNKWARFRLTKTTEHPNITLIGSAIGERAILGALDVLGPDRLCFGSDMPFGLMHVQLAMVRALLRDHDNAAQAKVLGGNLARVLQLVT